MKKFVLGFFITILAFSLVGMHTYFSNLGGNRSFIQSVIILLPFYGFYYFFGTVFSDKFDKKNRLYFVIYVVILIFYALATKQIEKLLFGFPG